MASPLLLALSLEAVAGSGFWAGADAVCARASALEAADPATLGAAKTAKDELLAYCKSRKAPRFAARAEAERTASLGALAKAAGVTLPSAPSLPVQGEDDLAKRIAAAIPKSRDPLGPASWSAMRVVLGKACAPPEVKASLPGVCKLADAGAKLSLATLRAAALSDAVLLIERALDKAGAPNAAARDAKLVAGVVTAALRSGDLRGFAGRFAERAESIACKAQDGAECAAGEQVAGLALTIFTRLVRDADYLDKLPGDHFAQVVEEAARERLGQPTLVLPPAARERVAALVADVRAAVELGERLRGAGGKAKRGKLGVEEPLPGPRENAALLGVAMRPAVHLSLGLEGAGDEGRTAAWAELGERSIASVAGSFELASSLRSGGAGPDLRRALPLLRGLTTALATPDARALTGAVRAVVAVLPAADPDLDRALQALDVAVRLASARSANDVQRVARDMVMPIPPWLEPWVLDLNGSLPKLERSKIFVNGDVTLGYSGKRFGILGHAGYLSYDVRSQGTIQETNRLSAGGEAWLNINLSPATRLEIEANGAYAQYDTTAANPSNTTGVSFYSERSRMIRGNARVSFRYAPSDRFRLSVGVGGGVQRERFDTLMVVGASVTLPDQRNIAGHGEARFRVRWNAWEDVLSLGLKTDASLFGIHHDLHGITVAPDGTTELRDVGTIRQIEVISRAYIDLDVASFFGFMPSAHGGMNLVSLSSPDSGLALTPVFGVTLRRDAP